MKQINLIIALIVYITLNSIAQTTLYTTGFEFPSPYKNVLASTYDSVAYDHWRTNSKNVGYTFTRCVYDLTGDHGDEDDSLKNIWCFLFSTQITNGGLTPLNPNCTSITTQSLGISALNGPSGFTVNEYNFDCKMNTIIRNGVFCYWNNFVTDRWAYRAIPTTGFTNIQLTFDWKCAGSATTGYGQVGYSLDRGLTWTWLDTGGTSDGKYYGKPVTQRQSDVTFPAACNNQANFALGFRFYGDGSSDSTKQVSGPTFVIDNIILIGTSGSQNCIPPTLTAEANNVSGQYVVCPFGVSTPLELTSNSKGGSNCSGIAEYSWFNGSKYWDGVGFNINNPIFSETYYNILTSGTDSVRYTVTVRCSKETSCKSQSSVTAIVLKDPLYITATIGKPANGSSNHMSVSWGKVNGSDYKLQYSLDKQHWINTGFNGNKTTYDHNAGLYPNGLVFYRVQSYVGADSCSNWVIMPDTAYTACNYPVLTVSKSTSSGLDLTLGKDNNPNYTMYSIKCTTTNQYVHSDGTLGVNEIFQIKAQWQSITVKGLDTVTSYCFVATARNRRGDLQTMPTPVCKCFGVALASQTLGQIVKCADEDISFNVQADGTGVIKYQWYKGSIPISYTNSSVLTFKNLASWNTGVYHCIVSNGCGSQTSSNVTLMVNSKPVFDVTPFAYNKNTGDSLAFTVNPTGGGDNATYTFQWFKDGNKIDQATKATFTLNPITKNDAGEYSCRAGDSCGFTTQSVASLSVGDKNSELFGIVTYANKASARLHNVTVILRNIEKTYTDSTTTDSIGYFQFKKLAYDSYVITAKTTKKWGGVTPVDAMLLNRIYIGLLPMPVGVKFLAADVNKDNKINSIDALLINRRFIGTVKNFPAGNWVFTKDTVAVDGYVSHNIQGLCVGDVNADYSNIPYRFLPDINLITSCEYLVSGIGYNTEIPVRVTRDIELGALGLKFRVSGSEFRVIDIKSNIKGLIYNIEGNDVAIAWSAMNENLNMKNNDILFTLVMSSAFQVAGTDVELTIDPTSVMADGSANRLENETLSIPGLSFSNSQFAVRSFPNPFSNITNIEYTLPEACNVSLKIYNILGVEIANLVNTNQDAGAYKVTFNGTDLPGGAYMYKLTANGESRNYNQTKLMILSR